MRVSRAQAQRNREAVIDVASLLFREHGFDGIGLKELMKGAGLTHGGFYKQFESKEDLASQASKRAMEVAALRWSDMVDANPDDPLGAVTALYLSEMHRDEMSRGCPLVALGADAARQGARVKEAFEAGVKAYLQVLDTLVPTPASGKGRSRAMAVLSLMVGALTLSRMVNDNRLSAAVLGAAADQILEIAAT